MYVVIVGGGKIGEYLAGILLNSGNEVVLIEKDRKTADRLSVVLEGRYMVINGDGCDSRFQEDAGVRKADVFVAVTGQDDANLVSCEIAQRVFQVPRVVARVNNPRNMRIFHELGIESVSSTSLIANLIEEEALMGSMSVVTSLTHGNVALAEFAVTRFKTVPENHGIKLSQIDFPQGCLIVAVITSDEVRVADTDIALYPGYKVVAAVDNEVLDEVRTIFRNL